MTDKLKITIPERNKSSIHYTLHCILEVFLGLECDFECVDDLECYKINTEEAELVFPNIFFSNDSKGLFDKKNLPSQITFKKFNLNSRSFPLCILYGNDSLDYNQYLYEFGFDLVGACFFMLSRWEEIHIDQNDKHNRFPSNASVAHKFNFLDRPIVNEYVEFLWEILKLSGCKQKRGKREFKIIPTHDIDRMFLWYNGYDKFKTLSSSIIENYRSEKFKETFFHLKNGSDPYDTYDLLMNQSESIGEKALFYTLVGTENNYDARHSLNHDNHLAVLSNIKKRGHCIGLHPSYDTINNGETIKREKKILEDFTQSKVTESRQHYLRFDATRTPALLELSGIESDSSGAYADKSGFKYGTCYSFPMFDVVKRKVLNIYQKPLIVMESTLFGYEGLDTSSAIDRIKYLKDKVKLYKGDFVFLWHNSSFHLSPFSSHKLAFEELYI